ncbi:hypothetical protein I5591_19625 [Pseudomonas syringae pv. tomato]|uniref:Secreted protein n=1 Tax=Pseudomonas syringae TaxID=317 RepID=A0AAW4E279_PSESX|nr:MULTISPECIES: hypothetical protein [Pseudomonas syringae group]MBH0141972.1 hypothetical protein [Pseudomonas syringae pv. tomato]MBI6698954.1 hypothetical protein [Pseudomonas syringae]MBI6715701.1 hypothetical protein [Pseudomonas syringae]MBI6734780.1 hypothetical protein [Pseudomonas syringae]MBI6842435.1 hypothetical protein [Pseudomonas syringae]
MNRKIIFNTLIRSPSLTAIFFILALRDFATPEVRVYYSDKAARGVRYTWITDHRISRGGISPGGAISDAGHIFQKKISSCISNGGTTQESAAA